MAKIRFPDVDLHHSTRTPRLLFYKTSGQEYHDIETYDH